MLYIKKSLKAFEQIVPFVYLYFIYFIYNIARKTESPQRYMMELFCERANNFKPLPVLQKKLLSLCLTWF